MSGVCPSAKVGEATKDHGGGFRMVLEIAAGILLAWVIVSIVGAVVELLLGIAGYIVVNGIRAVQRYSLGATGNRAGTSHPRP